jgi:hypothetical protein
MAFAQFINSTQGRVLRIVAGIALIGIGLAQVGGASGLAIAAVGLIPLAAGVFDACLLAPILSVPWSGAKIRAMR